MLADAIEKLSEQAVAASGVEIIESLPGEPDDVYAVYNGATGSFERRTAECPRHYCTRDIADFIALVTREFQHAKEAGAPGVVFCGDGKIEALIDDFDRRERVWMRLPFTAEWNCLERLSGRREKLTQRALIDLLRVELPAAHDPDFLEFVRSLKIEHAADGRSEIRPGKESVSSSVRQAVQSDGRPFPDGVTLHIPVYDLPAIDSPRQRIECYFNVDTTDASFVLIPVAGTMAAALREVDSDIQARLIDALGDYTVVIQGQVT